MYLKGTGSMCVLVEHFKNNFFAMLYNPSHHSYEKHTLVFYVTTKNSDSQWRVKCKSREPGQCACLLSMSRTITMQGFIILAIIATEKHTLVFYVVT